MRDKFFRRISKANKNKIYRRYNKVGKWVNRFIGYVIIINKI